MCWRNVDVEAVKEMKKPKLSEIRAHYEGMVAKDEGAFYLLRLIERMGKALDELSAMHITFCDRCTIAIPRDGSPPIHEDDCPVPKARELLKESQR